MEIEGFLGVPALDVGAHCLMGSNFDFERDGAFVELAPLHVEICDFDFQVSYIRVEIVGDKEAFHTACYCLVETIEADGGAYFFYKSQ